MQLKPKGRYKQKEEGPEQKMRLRHWNVRKMYETGKPSQITSEMREFNFIFLGVNEIRWTGYGKII